MKKDNLPLTNIEKWKSQKGMTSQWFLYETENRSEELFTYTPFGPDSTYTKHGMAKGPTMIEGILIKWAGDPFDLINNDNEKK